MINNHYQYAKIKDKELWRFYIDGYRQQTEEGKRLKQDLFEDEPGYMNAIMSAHQCLNQEWDTILTPQFLIRLHALALAKVKTNQYGELMPIIDEESAKKFKDKKYGGYGISKKIISIAGLVEFLKKIINNEIDYANKDFKFILAPYKGGFPKKSVNDQYYNDYQDLLSETLQKYNLKINAIEHENILRYRNELNILNDKYKKIESEINQYEKQRETIMENLQGVEDSKSQLDKSDIAAHSDLDEQIQNLEQQYSECISKTYEYTTSAWLPIKEELCNFKNFVLRMEAQAKLKQLDQQGELTDFAKILLNDVLITDEHYCFLIPPLYSHEQHYEIVDGLISSYYTKIKQSQTDDEKLTVIIEFIRSLEQLHAFSDGNCRLNAMLLLNRELILNGFMPAMLFEPLRFGFFSIEELKKDVIDGIAYSKQYQSKIAILPSFEKLYRLAFSASDLNNSIYDVKFFSQNLSMLMSLQEILLDIKDQDDELDVVLNKISAFKTKIQNENVNALLDNLLTDINSLKNNVVSFDFK